MVSAIEDCFRYSSRVEGEEQETREEGKNVHFHIGVSLYSIYLIDMIPLSRPVYLREDVFEYVYLSVAYLFERIYSSVNFE